MAACGSARVLTSLFLQLLLLLPLCFCWNEGAVLLREVQALTLYRGRYTTARRTSPVPQLHCVGGSAGCSAFTPEVVQCQNRGWDGVDVQWECKADMDNWYRFGRIEVSCEGYNSPDDPYILKGSCGLEYTLELTAEGRQHHSSHGSSGFADFASSFFQGKASTGGGYYQQSGPSGEGTGSLIVIAVLLLLAYAVYKMFLCNPTHGYQQGPADYGNVNPPPPGFRPDYTGENCGYPGPGYGFADSYTRPHAAGTGFSFTRPGRTGGAGFWSGMGTGGLLGYLFGSQRRQPPMGPTNSTYFPSSSTPKTSSGTRTASGFGGTKRR